MSSGAGLSMERWLPIAGFPGYEVSDAGRVRSYWSRARRPAVIEASARVMRLDSSCKNGYLRAGLTRDGKQHRYLVHRLVLEAFVGPNPPGMEARHLLDNDPGNNHVANLAWGTHQENIDDRGRHGNTARGDRQGLRLHPDRVARGERSGQSKLTAAQVQMIRGSTARGVDLARELTVSQSLISAVRKKHIWRHV